MCQSFAAVFEMIWMMLDWLNEDKLQLLSVSA